ncbi:ATP-binding protein [Dokdonia sp.]|uniref:sensor histidine kinase n=1 Tax=Dokdonia sp. TaxID=2024995 RepID=UPI003264AD10
MVLRTIFITLSAIAAVYFFFEKQYIAMGIAVILLVPQISSLIYFINQTNRKVVYFFDAIKNEDFTLRFPEKLSVNSLEEPNHSLNMLNSMIQDIYVKKQAQEQYYQEILRQADIGIFTINQKGHILYANPTVQNLLNYRPLNHVKQLNLVDHDLYDLFKDLKPFENTIFKLGNERGKRELSLKCMPITIENQSLLLVVIHDIHNELDKKETDSWVKLIRVLTHEIMNTITPITSISESILKYFQVTGDEPTVEFNKNHINNTVKGLEVIKEQGVNLMEFVQSYRSFLSLPIPDKGIVSVQKLLDKVIVLMNQENQRDDIKLEQVVTPVDLELFIDEKQISQILINLVKNAIQSLNGQEDSTIRLIAGITNFDKKYIQISDNGPGIPSDIMEEIFVPFFTTKDTGTGIGLSLSKQIMHLHGGSLKVHSIAFEDTSFVLLF